MKLGDTELQTAVCPWASGLGASRAHEEGGWQDLTWRRDGRQSRLDLAHPSGPDGLQGADLCGLVFTFTLDSRQHEAREGTPASFLQMNQQMDK